jgi:putative transposase
VLVCDDASWHKSKKLHIPANIQLLFLPPYTPEMNPIEQIWKEVRQRGLRNEIFSSHNQVIDRLCQTLSSLTKNTIQSITGRDWILECF